MSMGGEEPDWGPGGTGGGEGGATATPALATGGKGIYKLIYDSDLHIATYT